MKLNNLPGLLIYLNSSMNAFSKKFLVMLTVVLPFFCSGQTSSEIEVWLTQNSTKISNDGNESYHFNKEHFNQKTIIALGEPTYGTSEAQVSREKLLEFLVQNYNVKFLALEAVSNCEIVNEFLLYGKGTAKAACKALDMWMYDTVETEKLMLWIRDYNQSRQRNEKIRFYGIDYAMQKINDKFLSDSLVTKGIISKNLLNKVLIADAKSFNNRNSSMKELNAYKSDLKILADSIASNKNPICKQVSADYFFYVSYLCKTLDQTIQAKIFGKNIPTYYRDSCMAENVRFISANNDHGKVLVGGHNAHVRKIPNETLGFFLSSTFGDKFYNIGIMTGEATFRAFVLDEVKHNYALKLNQIKDLKMNSLGKELEAIGFGSFYLDFSSAKKNFIYKRLFEKPKLNLYAGWLYDPENSKRYYLWDSLTKSYDAIIYYPQTHNSFGIK